VELGEEAAHRLGVEPGHILALRPQQQENGAAELPSARAVGHGDRVPDHQAGPQQASFLGATAA